MNLFLKKIFSKFPFFNKILNKFSYFNNQIEFLKLSIKNHEEYIKNISKENWNLRRKIKLLNKEKIRVVFVCWRPQVWGSLKTVYEAMKKDPSFETIILTIPNKKQLPEISFNHEIYESEGAEKFWKGDDIISGYNYENNSWLDLQQLKPDYVCFQQPYNVCRCASQKSSIVSKYAKIFYIAYYSFFNCNETNQINSDCTPLDFLSDLSFYFTQNDEDQHFMTERMQMAENSTAKLIKTGFPRYDDMKKKYNIMDAAWRIKSEDRFRIIWTPRWSTSEKNCHFFTYKDLLIKYCRNENDIDFVFRPHPQMFMNLNATGEFNDNDLQAFKETFISSNNMSIDYSTDFLPTFYTSSCLITDTSSIVPEYFLTGKPVIYCYRKDSLNSFAKNKGYTSGFYWVENWNELKETLDMLRNGKDPLADIRKQLIKTEFYIPKESSGHLIKEIIKKDFFDK